MAHAAGDAHEYPIYGAHFRVVFPILDADGDFVTGATGLDSERSIDCATFADCTNEATEIASGSGIYYLDLTGAEMTGSVIAVIVKTTSAGAKTTPITLYPKRTSILETGTAQAGAATTITLASGASTKDDYYNGLYVFISNNSPAGAQYQIREIVDYVGSTRVATIESAWGTNPSSASTYEIVLAETVGVAAWAGVKIGEPATAGIPDVNSKLINNATAPTITGDPYARLGAPVGASISADIAGVQSDTDNIQTRIPAALVSGRMDASVGAMASNVITAAASAADFLAEVNAEVDTALADYDAPTFAELDAKTDAIEADTQDIQARIPAALVSGRIDASVGAMANNTVTAAATAADFLAEVNAEVDTALADYDAPTFAELDTRTDTIEAAAENIKSRIPTALISGRIDSTIGAVQTNAITESGLAADTDAYQAKVWVFDDNSGSTDRYIVIWFKNGQLLTSGVTSPTIQVVKASDGSDLVASTAMTEIGSTETFKKDEGTNRMVNGSAYVAIVTASIDSSTRTWAQPIGRDS